MVFINKISLYSWFVHETHYEYNTTEMVFTVFNSIELVKDKLKTPFLPELQVVSEVACSEVFSVWKGRDLTASTKKKNKQTY